MATTDDSKPAASEAEVAAFLKRWAKAGGAEIANFQSYVSELCAMLAVDAPLPKQAESAANDYVFERDVHDPHDGDRERNRRIDLYKRDCFVMEAKQGTGSHAAVPTATEFMLLAPTAASAKGIGVRGTVAWQKAMTSARKQAERYVQLLPAGHGLPPFVLVVDVGYCIELWCNFARDGRSYTLFPDRLRFRIYHQPPPGSAAPSLADPVVRELLRKVWTTPLALDPAAIAVAVTREVSRHMADLAKELAGENTFVYSGRGPKRFVAEVTGPFLVRCLFTMFAEDVGLLPDKAFTRILQRCKTAPHGFAAAVTQLWRDMDQGSAACTLLDQFNPLRAFNGGMFHNAEALPCNTKEIEMLLVAAQFDWARVEPAIFGTLLERALSETARHKLGAHFTPRFYVERLVVPTVIDPLRKAWQNAQIAAAVLVEVGKATEALETLQAFHQELCAIRVLDPACGSGNFLYVALDLCKALEGEVQLAIDELRSANNLPPVQWREGTAESVHPRQFLGMDVNKLATETAEVVLWIGYLQWQIRNGVVTTDHELARKQQLKPVLEDLRNISNRDALLDWDGAPLPEIAKGKDGKPMVWWDGTMKIHPVTGNEVPDETKTKAEYVYPNARLAMWPKADFIVGNPPFIGNKVMRDALGSGYVQAIAALYPQVPRTSDFVMYWWQRAAELLAAGEIRGFGFITTNSIRMVQSRPVVAQALSKGARLAFAVADHPWVDCTDGAAVRVSMTVADRGDGPGRLCSASEGATDKDGAVEVVLTERLGEIHPDLTVGAGVHGAVKLEGNSNLALQGIIPLGEGFRLTPAEIESLAIPAEERAYLKPYIIGRDIAQAHVPKYVVDFFGLSEAEATTRAPTLMQRLMVTVKPERDVNRRDTRRLNWWLFGENAPRFRQATADLPRYIATIDTSKFKPFVFITAGVLPDRRVQTVCSPDAYHLGVLSSRVHQVWALAAGGTLEDRPTWTNTTCFLPFPFPDGDTAQIERIRDLGERLDAHRKRQQARHQDLTLTGLYNVLDALRAGAALTDKERAIHDKGLCTVLLQLHDELDAAVFDAYGWPADTDDAALLHNLVDLNAERAAEEKRGVVRWLRPEWQNPGSPKVVDAEPADVIDDSESTPEHAAPPAPAPAPVPLPAKPADAATAILGVLAAAPKPMTIADIEARFDKVRKNAVALVLAAAQTLGAVEEREGHWRRVGGGGRAG